MKEQHIEDTVTQACGLLILGFNESSTLSAAVLQQLAGLILFDLDARSLLDHQQFVSKNISSPEQLRALTTSLKEMAPSIWLSVDHEGGRDRSHTDITQAREGLTRLNPDYGFATTLSAYEIGRNSTNLQAPDEDLVAACKANAELMHTYGFDLVFAPVVDVHDARCPIIGALHRAYSKSVADIIVCARQQIAAYRAKNILSVIKHYPGHGRAIHDSHHDITDISDTWQEDELTPFKSLARESPLLMLGHLKLNKIDNIFPASISRLHVDYLRQFYPGIIMTDDLEMAGLTNVLKAHYADTYSALSTEQAKAWLFEKIILHVLSAGVECFIFGNQLQPFDVTDFIKRYRDVIRKLYIEQQIDAAKITRAYRRIQALKKNIQPC